jgi:hypothetical protein
MPIFNAILRSARLRLVSEASGHRIWTEHLRGSAPISPTGNFENEAARLYRGTECRSAPDEV